MRASRPRKTEEKRAKRINISLPWDVYEMTRGCPSIQISRICAEALRSACLELWAKGEQAKLECGLNE